MIEGVHHKKGGADSFREKTVGDYEKNFIKL